jgi:hypothetical protein
VWILVALELVGCLSELKESLSRRTIDQLCLDCCHVASSFCHKKHKKHKWKRRFLTQRRSGAKKGATFSVAPLREKSILVPFCGSF